MLRWWEGWGGAPGCYRYACVSLKFICWCVYDDVIYIYTFIHIYFHTYTCIHIENSGNCLCQACSPPAKFGIERRGHFEKNMLQHVAAGCWRWNNNEQKQGNAARKDAGCFALRHFWCASGHVAQLTKGLCHCCICTASCRSIAKGFEVSCEKM